MFDFSEEKVIPYFEPVSKLIAVIEEMVTTS